MNKATFNDEWISDETLSDPTPLPDIPGWFILVRPLPIRTKTKGGIITPDSYRDDMGLLTTAGKVLKVGQSAYKSKDFDLPWCREGDYISYPKYGGAKMTYMGVKLLLLEDRDVQMVLPNANVLDPTYKA